MSYLADDLCKTPNPLAPHYSRFLGAEVSGFHLLSDNLRETGMGCLGQVAGSLEGRR